MINKISKPLDLLNSLKGKKILLRYNDRNIVGKLVAFDIYINLVLENAREISPKKRKLGLTFFKGNCSIDISEYGGK